MESTKKIIGILGGVGPEASALFHQYILQATREVKVVEKDQDYPHILHTSFSSLLPDRTEYLLRRGSQNPAEGAFRILESMQSVAEKMNATVYVGIPCNTFHAPPIFDDVRRLLKNNSLPNIVLLNMREETVQEVSKNFPVQSRIGLLSTTGTRRENIYRVPLEKNGYSVVEVSDEMQEELHDTIYNSTFGLKAIVPVSSKAKSNFYKFADVLLDQGADTILLACTEIPLAFQGMERYENALLLDPLKVLARVLVEKVI